MDCPHQQLRPRIIKVEYKDSMLLHRHHITTLLQALLVLCTFSACINDEFADDVAGTGHTTHPCYLNIQLKFDENMSATRAADTNDDNLEYGDHEEHMIGETGNYIILFKDNNLFDVCELTAMTGHKHNTEDGRPEKDGGDDSNKNNGVDDNIEATYTYSSKFDAEDEEDFPTSCLVVLNGSEKISKKLEGFKGQKGKGVSDILSIVWDETKVEDNPKDIGFSDDTHKYFTLTNSIYFDENGKKQTTKAIPAEFIGKTLAEAKLLTIYVERMVAKFSFTTDSEIYAPKKADSETVDPLIFFEGINENGTIDYQDRYWQIKVTGWGINAFETQNYLFKNIKNKQPSYFENWNNASNYRAHWSEDPHYDIDNETNEVWSYPWQYRWAVDKELNYYKALEKVESANGSNNNLLRNYSYNDIYSETNPTIDGRLTDKFGRIVYTPENTYDPTKYVKESNNSLDSRTNLLAGTHLIVCAELQTILDGTTTYKSNNVYRDRTGIFFESEKDCFVALAYAFNQTMESNSSMKVTCYDWTNGGVKDKALYAKPTGDRYFLYYNGEKLTNEYLSTIKQEWTDEQFEEWFGSMSPATIRHGDGKLLLWSDKLYNQSFPWEIKTDSEVKLALYEKDSFGTDKDGHYIDIPGEFNRYVDADDIKSLLYEWVGAVDHFCDGKMYYPAPVLHNGVKKEKPSQDTMGDYGVVRNNWYKFKLNDITSFGIPVDAPNEPIVPELIDINDAINVSVSIFDWHLVDTTAPVL